MKFSLFLTSFLFIFTKNSHTESKFQLTLFYAKIEFMKIAMVLLCFACKTFLVFSRDHD